MNINVKSIVSLFEDFIKCKKCSVTKLISFLALSSSLLYLRERYVKDDSVYLSVFILCFAYFVVLIIFKIEKEIEDYFKYIDRAKRYLRGSSISQQENKLLVEAFYDKESGLFNRSGTISLCEGCILSLENNYIITRGSNLTSFGTYCDYVLQPYITDYLNKSLTNHKAFISNNILVWC